MRYKFLLMLILASWQLLAASQVSVPPSLAMDAQAERQRIAQERAAQNEVFLKAERECYSRFAVSDCLRAARKNRRLAMDELRRQELVLNDLDRKTRALEAHKRIEANLAEQQKQNANSAPTPR
jgi:hypothetical protein